MTAEQLGEMLCLERDAFRCKHCGTADNVAARKISEIKGRFEWHLSNLVCLCENCHDKSVFNDPAYYKNRVGVILAGGSGTRLAPLSIHRNKHMLSLGNTPLIFNSIKTIRHFGIKRTIIISSQSGVAEMAKVLGSGKEWGMEFLFRVQEGAFGIANALSLAEDFVKPNDQIFCILGDNIFDNKGLHFDEDRVKAKVYLKKVATPEHYGVALVENGVISSIVEKPKTPVSDLAVVGLYVYDYDVFEVIRSIKPSANGEVEISSVNDFFAKCGELEYGMVNGYWNDAGSSIQKYLECFIYGAKQAHVSEEEAKEFVSLVFDNK